MAELDEEYIARMEELLGLYEKPVCERAPVVCIDEKPVVLHADIRSPMAMKPGRAARRDYEYKRCGTANVVCGIEPQAGRYFTKVTPARCSAEFADYLLDIAASYGETDTIHLVMDNLSTHTRKALVQRFGEEAGGWLWKRFTAHYTPKHGSWLNPAEMEVSLLSRQCLEANAESETSLACASQPGPGIVVRIATGLPSSGSSHGSRPDTSFVT